MTLLIDPVNKITDFNRNLHDLQLFWLFSILVAGKRADVTAALLTRMFRNLPGRGLRIVERIQW